MGVKAKICGISTPGAATAALEGGAQWLGFMFFAKSPRNLAPDAAARLAQPVRGQAKIVAVLVDPDDGEVDRVAQALKPDLIQLHGAETPARARAIGVRAGAGIIKALPVSEASDLAQAARAGAAERDRLDVAEPEFQAQLQGRLLHLGVPGRRGRPQPLPRGSRGLRGEVRQAAAGQGGDGLCAGGLRRAGS